MFLLFKMQKQASCVQRSYERSELEKAGRFPNRQVLKLLSFELPGFENQETFHVAHISPVPRVTLR